jgi:hypothetical protein
MIYREAARLLHRYGALSRGFATRRYTTIGADPDIRFLR